MRLLASITLASLLAPQAAWGAEVILHFGPHTVRAEIASTEQQREQGLMARRTLCADCGMLFVFPVAARHAFWMKDTLLPLSIAFVAADGSIINIAEMQPETLDVHRAEGNALFALEMNGGWFSRHRILPGAKLRGLEKLGPGN